MNSVIHIFLTNTEKVTDALERMLMEIPYASLPEDMIDTITVDVEGMPCGTVLTVGDIPELNSGKLDLQADKTEIVLRISDKNARPVPRRKANRGINTDVRHYWLRDGFLYQQGRRTMQLL